MVLQQPQYLHNCCVAKQQTEKNSVYTRYTVKTLLNGVDVT